MRALVSAVCFAAVCGMYSAAAAAGDPAAQYRPIKIAAGVLQKPGSVAWSSDGKTIAFLGDTLRLYDVAAGSLRETDLLPPLFLSPGPGRLFYLLYGEDSRGILAGLDPVTLEKKETRLPERPDAVVALPDNRRLLLVSVRLDQKKLWAELSYQVSVMDLHSAITTKVFETQKTIPGRVRPQDYQSAWFWPGPRPFDTAMLSVEYVKPPVQMPYLKIGLADYHTGRSREFGRIDHRSMSVPVSWSPDGNRFAFPTSQGRLGIYRMGDTAQGSPPGVEHITGLYPAWNPRGSQIYFGGHIIHSDGSGSERILEGGEESMGLWSPDGSMLAVAHRGGLYLFRDIRATLIPPDRIYPHDFLNKRMLLKELLLEKLITDKEYEERWNNLLKTTE